jgi:hypothetical protein
MYREAGCLAIGTASEDVLEPLERLYRASSSLALYAAEDGEDVTPSAFERYE